MADINIGAILEALNNKVDLPTPSTPQNAVDYVVEKQDPTADNNYTWYRKYKSGWVEQGGQTANDAQSTVSTITLPVAMLDSNYTVSVVGTAIGNGYIFRAKNRTKTTFQIACDTFSSGANPTGARLWCARGQSE